MLIGQLDMAEERITELDNMPMEIIQTEIRG